MRRTVFEIPKMDCPAEERLIRMALDGVDGVSQVECDLEARVVSVHHEGEPAPILAKLEPLSLGARIVSSKEGQDVAAVIGGDADEARTLRVLLAINAVMFLVEMVVGWLAQSTGLIADSVDMLADAMVYGLSLYAVGRTTQGKVRAAHVSGIFQAVLAVGVLLDVGRRYLTGSEPEASAMIGVSFLALVANVTCLVLISKHRHGGAHMKASWIFSTNDVLANLGVILSGVLVTWTGSRIPDLTIGSLIAIMVSVGAYRILRLR